MGQRLKQCALLLALFSSAILEPDLRRGENDYIRVSGKYVTCEPFPKDRCQDREPAPARRNRGLGKPGLLANTDCLCLPGL